VLLPVGDDAEPMPVSVSGLESLQALVGGYIDATYAEYDTEQMPLEFDEYAKCRIVGYLHDEGAINGMEMNKLATLMFRQPLFGPVVVVGDCDDNGENTELPDWFLQCVYSGALQQTVELLDSQAHTLAVAVKFAVEDGLLEHEEALKLGLMMVSDDPETVENAEFVLQEVLKYYIGRKTGVLDQITPDQIAEARALAEQDEISDEEIYKWLEEGDQ